MFGPHVCKSAQQTYRRLADPIHDTSSVQTKMTWMRFSGILVFVEYYVYEITCCICRPIPYKIKESYSNIISPQKYLNLANHQSDELVSFYLKIYY
jgi:hypothetical protein